MLEAALLKDFSPQLRDLLRFTWQMLDAIDRGDSETYCDMCVENLTCFEPEISPHRIDGLDFHRCMMTTSREIAAPSPIRFEMLTPSVQIYETTGIVTYTRLRTYSDDLRIWWHSCNETRVFVRRQSAWKMAHFHRSPAGTLR